MSQYTSVFMRHNVAIGTSMANNKPKNNLNKISWLEAGFQMLAEGGIDSVRVDRIAKKIGLTRGSFYWHFNSRAEFLDAMLALWHQKGTHDIINLVEQEKLNPNKRLSALLHLTTQSPGPKYGGKFAELSIRVWGANNPQAASVIKQVDGERIAFVNKLLLEMKVEPATASLLAEIIYNAYIGMMSRDISEEEVTRIGKIATTFIENQLAEFSEQA